MAGFLGIEPEKIKIICSEEGSIIITVELPYKPALKLIDAIRQKDPEVEIALDLSEKKFFTPMEVAKMAGISIETVKKYLKKKEKWEEPTSIEIDKNKSRISKSSLIDILASISQQG